MQITQRVLKQNPIGKPTIKQITTNQQRQAENLKI